MDNTAPSSPPIPVNTEIASRIRRRAFRSRNGRAALKLLKLADEVSAMHLPNGERLLMLIGNPPPKPGDTPQLRRLRRKKRWLDVARPLTRHPRLLERLAELLPRARNRPGARLREDLRLDDAEVQALAHSIEEAFEIRIDRRELQEWENHASISTIRSSRVRAETRWPLSTQPSSSPS